METVNSSWWITVSKPNKRLKVDNADIERFFVEDGYLNERWIGWARPQFSNDHGTRYLR